MSVETQSLNEQGSVDESFSPLSCVNSLGKSTAACNGPSGEDKKYELTFLGHPMGLPVNLEPGGILAHKVVQTFIIKLIGASYF